MELIKPTRNACGFNNTDANKLEVIEEYFVLCGNSLICRKDKEYNRISDDHAMIN